LKSAAKTEHEPPWPMLGQRRHGAIFRGIEIRMGPAGGYESEAEAKVDIMAYLVRYNLKPLHSYNGYETPVAMEEKLRAAA